MDRERQALAAEIGKRVEAERRTEEALWQYSGVRARLQRSST
jgi:hypothetical protein